MTQGERVKAIRKELNMTLEQFGEKLGVTKTAISYVENNKRNLTEQMLLSYLSRVWLSMKYGFELVKVMSKICSLS